MINRIVVCGAGAVDHGELVRIATEKFGSIPTHAEQDVTEVYFFLKKKKILF